MMRPDAVYCSTKCRKSAFRYRRRTGDVSRAGDRDALPPGRVDGCVQAYGDGCAPATRGASGVAVLFVDRRGVYPSVVPWSRCWDVHRDAMTYAGPWPVVAHPPCAPWSVMRGLSSGEGWECAPWAVQAVRRWGGVLEHPANSALWGHADLPRPGDMPDHHGGYSIAVNQSAWGHPADKPTWLYIVGGSVPRMPPNVAAPRPGVRDLSSTDRRRTPEPFARWLVAIAATATTRDGFGLEAGDGSCLEAGDG